MAFLGEGGRPFSGERVGAGSTFFRRKKTLVIRAILCTLGLGAIH
jgi:hypothetical protein